MAAKYRTGFQVWGHAAALMAVVAAVAVGVEAQGSFSGAVVFPNPPSSRNPISFGGRPPNDFAPRGPGVTPVRPNPIAPVSTQPGTSDSDSPRCAQGQDYCENDPEYPRLYIRNLLSRRASIVNLVRDPLLRNMLSDSEDLPINPGQPATRIGITETPACQATETLIYPQRGKRASSDWVFIVNDENVQQAVRVEKCTRANSSCELGRNLPISIGATCRQKYIYRKLLVVDSRTADLASESVLMPSCCVCYIKRSENNINARIPANRRFPTTPADASPTSLAQPATAGDRRNINNFPNNG